MLATGNGGENSTLNRREQPYVKAPGPHGLAGVTYEVDTVSPTLLWPQGTLDQHLIQPISKMLSRGLRPAAWC